MKLKESNRTPWLVIAVRQMWHKRSRLFIGVLLYSLLVFVFGAYLHRTGFLHKIKLLITENVSTVPRIVRGMLSKPEHITIDIQYEYFMKLAHKRQVALSKGILVSSSEDYVPAKIRYKDQTINVKLRLKGDMGDHWGGDKWSLRVIVKGDNTLFGMKRFSLQHPQTRQYIYEWLYHQALKREGVLSLRYDFIDVTINGKDMGIYALEEHFEKRLIENNERREGPIVRFSEDIAWKVIAQQTYLPMLERFEQSVAAGEYLSTNIDMFQSDTWLSDPATYGQHLAAVQTLESFRQGSLKTSEVFDIEKLARFFALSDVLGAEHSTRWQNTTFYYNPITARLEPIGFDGYHYSLRIKSLIPTLGFFTQTLHDNLYIRTLFSDREFFKQYIKELERMSKPSYLDDLFAELNEDIERNLSIIYREFPLFHFTKDIMYENQGYVRITLNPPKGLHAYYHRARENHIELELGNIQYLPVEVIGVSYNDSFDFRPDGKVILPEKNPLEPLYYHNVSFMIPEGLVWLDSMIAGLQAHYRILGTSQIKSETVFS